MNAISLLVGFICMIGLLCYNVVSLVQRQDMDSSLMLAILMVSALLSILFGSLMRTLTLAILVSIFRGRNAVEWCSPSTCTSFGTWFASSWNFFSVGGRHQGMRVCGLEIALQGSLHSPSNTEANNG